MTVDEELNKLEDDIRRLKIEYEVYFNGGSQRLPQDMIFRIEKLIKRYSAEASKLMSFGQRFRFNSLVMKYTIQNELWKKKIREKEEGRGRFAARPEAQAGIPGGSIRIICSDPDKEKGKVDELLKAMVQAKRQVGERIDNIDPLAFSKFVSEKTQQIKESLGCEKVQFSVSVENGKVKLKAVKAE